MTDDPNIAYKRAFAELEAQLGRPPTPRDDGWLRLGNEYSRSWGPAEETLVKPSQRRRPEQTGFSRQPAPQASAIDRIIDNAREAYMRQAEAHVLGTLDEYARQVESASAREPQSGARIIPTREGAESVPEPPVAAPGVSQSLTVGSRGPSGGIVAECRKCGRAWERENRKGRPAALCGECR